MKNTIIYLEGPDGDNYKFIVYEGYSIDSILDQLNMTRVRYIPEVDCVIKNPLDVEIENDGEVFGIMTCENPF